MVRAVQRSLKALALLLVAMPLSAHGAEQAVRFPPGATSTTLNGTLRGRADQTYEVETVAGQVMQTLLRVSNRSCYFNVYEPGQDEAAHIGSISGNEFGRSPTKTGTYRFQIYLVRAAARRNESCHYNLSIEITGKPGGASAGVSDLMMRDVCRAGVADMYAVTSHQIRQFSIRSDKTGPYIDGTINKGAEGIKRFRCLFTPDRNLRDIRAMTPDGE